MAAKTSVEAQTGIDFRGRIQMISKTKVLVAAAFLAAAAAPGHAQTAGDLTAAAKATRIEGRWFWDKTGLRCSTNPDATGYETIEIADGALVRTYMDFGSKLVARYAITRVEGNT